MKLLQRSFHRFAVLPFLAAALELGAAPASLPKAEPPAWRLTHPEAQILAGVDFHRLAASPEGAALSKRFAAALGPDLVERAQSLLLSAAIDSRGRRSDLLILSGNFELSRLRKLAIAEGARISSYKGVEIAAAPGAGLADPHLAWLDGSTVLVGTRPAIVAAADRARAQIQSLSSVNALHGRAADLTQTFPVWVVCDTLPEGLGPASLDALLDEPEGIQGIDLAFHLDTSAEFHFWVWTGKDTAARKALEQFQSAAAAPGPKFLLRPFLAEMKGAIDGSTLTLGASLAPRQAIARLSPVLAAFGLPIEAAGTAPAQAAQQTGKNGPHTTGSSGSASTQANPATSSPSEPAPARKLFVRIEGLEQGSVSIPFAAH